MTRQITGWLGIPLLLLVLSACVTINIYFPAAAAEEAARTIVRDVLNSEAPAEPGSQQPQSHNALPSPWLIAAGRVLHLVVPAAHAAQANIDINTPAIRAIRASMQQRQGQLAAFYSSGAVGFDLRGDVAVRDLKLVSLKDRNLVNKLVSDENADRASLYREIARANGHPEWEGQVRETFARVWAEEARPGYWYQTSGGSWQQR
ncbi:MAG: YdbL family protein [Gammaproteobacteria bacterium]|nr:YdbL family protein [Gammaproteobacteria bacterium]